MFRGNPAILQLGVFTVINFCFSMGGRVGQMLSNPEKYLCQSAECLVGRKQSREMTMAPDIGFLQSVALLLVGGGQAFADWKGFAKLALELANTP
jgi:hypothetical protein